jgi:hypothetical protein
VAGIGREDGRMQEVCMKTTNLRYLHSTSLVDKNFNFTLFEVQECHNAY